jgi:hypothetical protein
MDTAAGSLASGDDHQRPLEDVPDGRARIEPGYNAAVPDAIPQPPPDRRSQERQPKHHIYKVETAGILIIGILILILTLARYWHHIAWSAR